ncbi:MAG TPA: DnaJ domain-containing protein, partial [Usitatibacter sp.]|nr:DnaJ domain-containing protein [Usitatibacter sp.]
MRVLRQGWKCYGTLHFTRYDRGRSIPTHYQILGLSRDASSVDIANAFREKLASARARPDADERSEAIRSAYQVLANPASRAQYDAGLPPDPRLLRERAKRER